MNHFPLDCSIFCPTDKEETKWQKWNAPPNFSTKFTPLQVMLNHRFCTSYDEISEGATRKMSTKNCFNYLANTKASRIDRVLLIDTSWCNRVGYAFETCQKGNPSSWVFVSDIKWNYLWTAKVDRIGGGSGWLGKSWLNSSTKNFLIKRNHSKIRSRKVGPTFSFLPLPLSFEIRPINQCRLRTVDYGRR